MRVFIHSTKLCDTNKYKSVYTIVYLQLKVYKNFKCQGQK